MWHHDVTNARTCQFFAVCLTVFPFEFRPRTFTIGFYGKNSIISEHMILECSFPLILSVENGCLTLIMTASPGDIMESALRSTGLANCAKRACMLLSIYYLMVISCNTFGVATFPNVAGLFTSFNGMNLNMWPCPSSSFWHCVRWISGALNEHYSGIRQKCDFF